MQIIIEVLIAWANNYKNWDIVFPKHSFLHSTLDKCLNPINLNDILQRILNATSTDADIEDLRQWLESGGIKISKQANKYNVNIEQLDLFRLNDRNLH
jgi:Effector-associated domain 10